MFAGAGLACGLSDQLSTLIVARCVQALGGAAAVTAALELLPATVGSERRAAADGQPRRCHRCRPRTGGRRRPHPARLLAVNLPAPGAACDRGGCTDPRGRQARGRDRGSSSRSCAPPAARTCSRTWLWRWSQRRRSRPLPPRLAADRRLAASPIAAAIVVSVIPLSALAGSRLGRRVPSARARAAAGAILVSGGLAGLGLLPRAEVALTLPPQVLVGVGLSLVLSALTETALRGRASQAIHGGWTISARHAGVVIGLLALTPIFTADIAKQRSDAIEAGTAVVLESKVEPLLKIDLAQRIAARIAAQKGKVPTIGPAFEPLPSNPTERAEVLQLRGELQDQLDRGATHAFSPSFLLGALLGALALVPIGLARRVEL